MKNYLKNIKDRREKLMKTLRKTLMDEAIRLANLLKSEKFEFKRIYLFGSLVKDKPLAPWTDIDLAVEKLPSSAFYKMYSFLIKNSKFSIDLKPYEELDKALKEKIMKEGKIIYEKR